MFATSYIINKLLLYSTVFNLFRRGRELVQGYELVITVLRLLDYFHCILPFKVCWIQHGKCER